MTEKSAPEEIVIPIPADIEEVNELLKRYHELSNSEKDALAKEEQIIKATQSLTADVVDPIRQHKEAIRVAMKTYFNANRKSVLARFGRTIELSDGTIKFRIIAKSLEVPKDTKPIVRYLLNRRGGKKYLRPTWALDKDALVQADPGLLHLLNRRFRGFWAGRHEHISIKPTDEDEPITISVRRFPGGAP